MRGSSGRWVRRSLAVVVWSEQETCQTRVLSAVGCAALPHNTLDVRVICVMCQSVWSERRAHDHVIDKTPYKRCRDSSDLYEIR